MSESTKPELEPDYSLTEVAKAIGMSTRWIRDRVNDPDDPAEHLRYGHKIRFTDAQVKALRARHTKAAPSPVTAVTTGRKKSVR
jgi:hypothetical protein